VNDTLDRAIGWGLVVFVGVLTVGAVVTTAAVVYNLVVSVSCG